MFCISTHLETTKTRACRGTLIPTYTAPQPSLPLSSNAKQTQKESNPRAQPGFDYLKISTTLTPILS
jgi:hypothetical protein